MTFMSNEIDGSIRFKATRNNLVLKIIQNEQINGLIFLHLKMLSLKSNQNSNYAISLKKMVWLHFFS
jgi:hypothetical protein